MRPTNFLAFSKRLAKVAIDLRKKAGRQPFLQAASDRFRGLVVNTKWPVFDRKRGTALAVYVAEGQVTTGHLIADHVASVVHKRLTRLTQCKDFQAAKDPVEALHDLRVASRRLRAFVDVFEPLLDPDIRRRTKGPLRSITRAVRSLRDWDVQTGLLNARLSRATLEIEKIALEDLLAAAMVKRKREVQLAQKRLRKVDFDNVHFAVCATLGATVTHLPPPGSATVQLACDLLDPFLQEISADRPHDDGLEHAERLHGLRIRLKKLRYTLELLEPALGKPFEKLYEQVEQLQELLGKHHDLVVLDGIMERHRRHLAQDNRGTLSHALLGLQNQLDEERLALVAQFHADGFDPEWWRQELRHRSPPPKC